MPAPHLARLACILLLAATIGGCGVSDPYQTTTREPRTPTSATSTAPADRGDPAPERGGVIPKPAQRAQNRLAAGAARPVPQAALERYAALYLNWDASHVAQIQRQLAAISLGQARAQALQAATSAACDTQLTQSHLANHGEVLAVSPGQAAAAGKWVIVTREQTTRESDYQRLPATLHIIFAQVTRTESGWVVSEWAPQNWTTTP